MRFATVCVALAVMVPVLAGLRARRSLRQKEARAWGLWGHGVALTCILAAFAAYLDHSLGQQLPMQSMGGQAPDSTLELGPALLLRIDGFSALAGLVSTLVAAAVFVAAPRRDLHRAHVAASLWTQSAALATLFAGHLAVLALVWTAVVLPGLLATRRGSMPLRRAYRYLLVGTTIPAAISVGLFLPLAAGVFQAPVFDLRALSLDGVPHTTAMLIFVPIVLGVLGRMAIVPFHGWLVLLLREGPIPVTTALLSSFSGVYLLVRLGVPIGAWASVEERLPLELVILFSAAYGAFLALGARSLQGAVAGLIMSQSAVITAGLFAARREAIGGALVLCIAEALAFAGLMLIARAIEGRRGSIALDRFRGLFGSMPRLSAGFFAFALATVGFPMLASAAGTELILDGMTSSELAFGIGLILITAVNAVAAMRVFCRVFLGPPERRGPPVLGDDMSRKEAVAALALGCLLLVFGVLPQSMIALVGAAAERIAS